MALAIAQQQPKPQSHQDSGKQTPPPSTQSTVQSQQNPAPQQGSPSDELKQSNWQRFTEPLITNWPLIAIALPAIWVGWRTLVAMRESSERQLRAYMIVERGIVANVANPLSELGKKQETVAKIIQPLAGPVAQITIKNTGQTPAYDVVHWGNMKIREFPLASELPVMPPPPGRFWSVLGPSIAEVKTLRIKAPLTEVEIQGLRDSSMAIYCHGEIHYRDAFKKVHVTHYRVMYCAVTGIEIGTSEDLSICESGNEAD